MQKQGIFLWTKRFFLLELFFGLGFGVSPVAGADAGLTNNPAAVGQLEYDSHLSLKASETSPWDGEVGQGFRKGAQETGFAAGWGFGIRHGVVGASTVSHNLALVTLRYGL